MKINASPILLGCAISAGVAVLIMFILAVVIY